MIIGKTSLIKQLVGEEVKFEPQKECERKRELAHKRLASSWLNDLESHERQLEQAIETKRLASLLASQIELQQLLLNQQRGASGGGASGKQDKWKGPSEVAIVRGQRRGGASGTQVDGGGDFSRSISKRQSDSKSNNERAPSFEPSKVDRTLVAGKQSEDRRSGLAVKSDSLVQASKQQQQQQPSQAHKSEGQIGPGKSNDSGGLSFGGSCCVETWKVEETKSVQKPTILISSSGNNNIPREQTGGQPAASCLGGGDAAETAEAAGRGRQSERAKITSDGSVVVGVDDDDDRARRVEEQGPSSRWSRSDGLAAAAAAAAAARRNRSLGGAGLGGNKAAAVPVVGGQRVQPDAQQADAQLETGPSGIGEINSIGTAGFVPATRSSSSSGKAPSGHSTPMGKGHSSGRRPAAKKWASEEAAGCKGGWPPSGAKDELASEDSTCQRQTPAAPRGPISGPAARGGESDFNWTFVANCATLRPNVPLDANHVPPSTVGGESEWKLDQRASSQGAQSTEAAQLAAEQPQARGAPSSLPQTSSTRAGELDRRATPRGPNWAQSAASEAEGRLAGGERAQVASSSRRAGQELKQIRSLDAGHQQQREPSLRVGANCGPSTWTGGHLDKQQHRHSYCVASSTGAPPTVIAPNESSPKGSPTNNAAHRQAENQQQSELSTQAKIISILFSNRSASSCSAVAAAQDERPASSGDNSAAADSCPAGQAGGTSLQTSLATNAADCAPESSTNNNCSSKQAAPGGSGGGGSKPMLMPSLLRQYQRRLSNFHASQQQQQQQQQQPQQRQDHQQQQQRQRKSVVDIVLRATNEQQRTESARRQLALAEEQRSRAELAAEASRAAASLATRAASAAQAILQASPLAHGALEPAPETVAREWPPGQLGPLVLPAALGGGGLNLYALTEEYRNKLALERAARQQPQQQRQTSVADDQQLQQQPKQQQQQPKQQQQQQPQLALDCCPFLAPVGVAECRQKAAQIRHFSANFIDNMNLYEIRIVDMPTIEPWHFPTSSLLEWSLFRGRSHLLTADAYLLVFDLTRPSTIQYIKMLRDKIFESREMSHIPVYVIANKADMCPTLQPSLQARQMRNMAAVRRRETEQQQQKKRPNSHEGANQRAGSGSPPDEVSTASIKRRGIRAPKLPNPVGGTPFGPSAFTAGAHYGHYYGAGRFASAHFHYEQRSVPAAAAHQLLAAYKAHRMRLGSSGPIVSLRRWAKLRRAIVAGDSQTSASQQQQLLASGGASSSAAATYSERQQRMHYSLIVGAASGTSGPVGAAGLTSGFGGSSTVGVLAAGREARCSISQRCSSLWRRAVRRCTSILWLRGHVEPAGRPARRTARGRGRRRNEAAPQRRGGPSGGRRKRRRRAPARPPTSAKRRGSATEPPRESATSATPTQKGGSGAGARRGSLSLGAALQTFRQRSLETGPLKSQQRGQRAAARRKRRLQPEGAAEEAAAKRRRGAGPAARRASTAAGELAGRSSSSWADWLGLGRRLRPQLRAAGRAQADSAPSRQKRAKRAGPPKRVGLWRQTETGGPRVKLEAAAASLQTQVAQSHTQTGQLVRRVEPTCGAMSTTLNRQSFYDLFNKLLQTSSTTAAKSQLLSAERQRARQGQAAAEEQQRCEGQDEGLSGAHEGQVGADRKPELRVQQASNELGQQQQQEKKAKRRKSSSTGAALWQTLSSYALSRGSHAWQAALGGGGGGGGGPDGSRKNSGSNAAPAPDTSSAAAAARQRAASGAQAADSGRLSVTSGQLGVLSEALSLQDDESASRRGTQSQLQLGGGGANGDGLKLGTDQYLSVDMLRKLSLISSHSAMSAGTNDSGGGGGGTLDKAAADQDERQPLATDEDGAHKRAKSAPPDGEANGSGGGVAGGVGAVGSVLRRASRGWLAVKRTRHTANGAESPERAGSPDDSGGAGPAGCAEQQRATTADPSASGGRAKRFWYRGVMKKILFHSNKQSLKGIVTAMELQRRAQAEAETEAETAVAVAGASSGGQPAGELANEAEGAKGPAEGTSKEPAAVVQVPVGLESSQATAGEPASPADKEPLQPAQLQERSHQSLAVMQSYPSIRIITSGSSLSLLSEGHASRASGDHRRTTGQCSAASSAGASGGLASAEQRAAHEEAQCEQQQESSVAAEPRAQSATSSRSSLSSALSESVSLAIGGQPDKAEVEAEAEVEGAPRGTASEAEAEAEESENEDEEEELEMEMDEEEELSSSSSGQSEPDEEDSSSRTGGASGDSQVNCQLRKLSADDCLIINRHRRQSLAALQLQREESAKLAALRNARLDRDAPQSSSGGCPSAATAASEPAAPDSGKTAPSEAQIGQAGAQEAAPSAGQAGQEEVAQVGGREPLAEGEPEARPHTSAGTGAAEGTTVYGEEGRRQSIKQSIEAAMHLLVPRAKARSASITLGASDCERRSRSQLGTAIMGAVSVHKSWRDWRQFLGRKKSAYSALQAAAAASGRATSSGGKTVGAGSHWPAAGKLDRARGKAGRASGGEPAEDDPFGGGAFLAGDAVSSPQIVGFLSSQLAYKRMSAAQQREAAINFDQLMRINQLTLTAANVVMLAASQPPPRQLKELGQPPSSASQRAKSKGHKLKGSGGLGQQAGSLAKHHQDDLDALKTDQLVKSAAAIAAAKVDGVGPILSASGLATSQERRQPQAANKRRKRNKLGKALKGQLKGAGSARDPELEGDDDCELGGELGARQQASEGPQTQRPGAALLMGRLQSGGSLLLKRSATKELPRGLAAKKAVEPATGEGPALLARSTTKIDGLLAGGAVHAQFGAQLDDGLPAQSNADDLSAPFGGAAGEAQAEGGPQRVQQGPQCEPAALQGRQGPTGSSTRVLSDNDMSTQIATAAAQALERQKRRGERISLILEPRFDKKQAGADYPTLFTSHDLNPILKDLAQLVRKHWRCNYIECSAASNWNIRPIISELTRALECNQRLNRPKMARGQPCESTVSATGQVSLPADCGRPSSLGADGDKSDESTGLLSPADYSDSAEDSLDDDEDLDDDDDDDYDDDDEAGYEHEDDFDDGTADEGRDRRESGAGEQDSWSESDRSNCSSSADSFDVYSDADIDSEASNNAANSVAAAKKSSKSLARRLWFVGRRRSGANESRKRSRVSSGESIQSQAAIGKRPPGAHTAKRTRRLSNASGGRAPNCSVM